MDAFGGARLRSSASIASIVLSVVGDFFALWFLCASRIMERGTSRSRSMASFFEWLQATGVATTVRDSLMLTGSLSAVHLLGFTLTTGGGLVANLRLAGVLLRETPLMDVARPAGRGVAIGLAISATTGVLLFAPRAVDASANRIFQTKMLLLAVAAIFHLTVHRRATRHPGARPEWLRAVGATGLLLWCGVALAGAAFILLE